MPKKIFLLITFIIILLSLLIACDKPNIEEISEKVFTEQELIERSAYDSVTVSILEEIIAKNFPQSQKIKKFTDLKAVWSDASPKQLLELDLSYYGCPNGEVYIYDLPYLEKLQIIRGANVRYANMKLNLANLPCLKTLIAYTNGINSINEIKGLKTMTSLEVLDLRDNKISKIEGLEMLVDIKELRLSKNHIKQIENLENLLVLRKFCIGSNELTSLKGLEKCLSLEELDVSRCQFKDLSGLQTLTKLKNLILRNNNVADISALVQLTELEKLDLSYNRITNPEIIANLANLKWLDLSYNDLEGNVDYLRTLRSLRYLNLAGYKITNFSIFQKTTFPLDELGLNNTGITYSDFKYLADNPILQTNLKTLNLAANKLPETFDFTLLSNLKELKLIDIQKNSIQAFAGLDVSPRGFDYWYNSISLSEAYKLWQLGIITKRQDNALFDGIKLKVGEPLAIPENEIEIDGVKTLIRVYSLNPYKVNQGMPNERTEHRPFYHKINKTYKIEGNQIIFLKPGEYYLRMTSTAMMIHPANIKSGADYVSVTTGKIIVETE